MVTYLNFVGAWVSEGGIRAHGIYPGEPGRAGHVEDPRVLLEIFDQSEKIATSAEERLGLTITEQGAEAPTIWIVFDSERPISERLGNNVTLRGQLIDACGNTTTDELEVIVACAPDDDYCTSQL